MLGDFFNCSTPKYFYYQRNIKFTCLKFLMEQLRAPCIFERVSHQENLLPMSKVSGVAGVEGCQVEHVDLKSIKFMLNVYIYFQIDLKKILLFFQVVL